MTLSVTYEGDLRCKATHTQSGTIVETDAPTDNKGKGERFSPTDTVCLALATCIVTTMGIKAMDMDIDLAGTTMEVQKYMITDPRRIGQIDVTIKIPETLNVSEKDRSILERVAHNCPVAKSLHPEVKQQISFSW